MQKPSIPKGTRDFSPDEMAKRNYIFDTIRSVFYLYGFQQIETPAMENLSTLMGKYGEEGDKLLFKILNSGDFIGEVNQEELLTRNSVKLTNKISEKGLRYDLTVPFARYVVMHRNEIDFPFKRFQIQPVWRADRPQKGRYREFFQCDADVVGSDSLLNEVELIQIIDDVFKRFGLHVCIKINNRKILSGIAEIIGETERLTDITVAIDKFDKIGAENVNKELQEKGLTMEAIAKLQPILQLEGSNTAKLNSLKTILASSETGLKGIEELETIFNLTDSLHLGTETELDLRLARGLNYYTGAILEVKALDTEMGSITGGGRYDNLTGVFGLTGVSGVGISFGADRIFDVLNTLNLYPAEAMRTTKVLFTNFGEKECAYCLPIIKAVREAGIAAEIFPEASKMKKQMSYANTRKVEFVAIAGETEMAANSITLKNMTSGEQQLVPVGELVSLLK
ncbi:MAG: histidine--tRNA ligase [Bacteroidales bacterium]|nr:histidine--tRNA ligase [Bacteroidales bacterium]